MVLYGVRLLINIFDMFIYRRYLENFVGKRRTETEVSLAVLLVLALIGSGVNQIEHPVLNLTTTICILFLYQMQYETRRRSRIVTTLVYLGIIFLTEPLGYLFYIIVLGRYQVAEEVHYFFIAFFMELLRMVIVEVFCYQKKERKVSLAEIPKEVVYILGVVPLLSILSCILVVEMAKGMMSGELIILCMTVIFTIIVCNYFMFIMISRYTEVSERQRESELLEREIVLKEAYYRDMEEVQRGVHRLEHNMKHQLLGIYEAIDDEKGNTAKTKIQEIIGELKELEDVVYSENMVLNAILKAKLPIAEDKEIRFTHETFLPRRINMDSGDMGVLFGNLVDNAIEACEKLAKDKREIHLEVKYQVGKLVISIKNSKEEKENPDFKSSKKDKRKHGFGLNSISTLAEKYGGTLLLHDHGNCFEANIMLTGIGVIE